MSTKPVKYLRGAPRDIMQLIIADGSVRWGDVGEITGWEAGSAVLSRMKMAGLVERRVGRWWATEKGKLAFALVVGKEHRRLCLLRQFGQHNAQDRSAVSV